MSVLWMSTYLGVFEARDQYDFLSELCCEWVQLHCDQSASRGQQTQHSDRAVATVHPQLQHSRGANTPHHLIQRLAWVHRTGLVFTSSIN